MISVDTLPEAQKNAIEMCKKQAREKGLTLPVVIPSGSEKAPRKESDLETHLGGRGVPCKHLRGKVPGKFRCVLHDRRWYRETPCYRHGQVEVRDTPCRMGTYVLADRARWWFLKKED